MRILPLLLLLLGNVTTRVVNARVVRLVGMVDVAVQAEQIARETVWCWAKDRNMFLDLFYVRADVRNDRRLI